MSYQPPSQSGGTEPPDEGQTGASAGDTSGSAGSSGDYGGYSSQGGSYTQPTGDAGSQGGSYTQPIGGDYGQQGGQSGQSGQGGNYTQPVGGSYTPPQGGGYSPPPSGGYNPPPGGGYSPPPAGGGYSPPPSGGYNPPPGGGYNPNNPNNPNMPANPNYVPQGGYGAPPPPPGGPGGPGGFNMNSLDRNVTIGNSSFNIGQLVQSWINAVTKPNVSTFEAEAGNASWVKVLAGIALVAVVGFITSLLFGALNSSFYNGFYDSLSRNGNVGNFGTLRNYATGGGAFGALISPFITFFLGAGLQYLIAKMLGGTGNSFLTHSYLTSISWTPLRFIGALPVIGCIGPILMLYQIYLAGVSMQTSQRLQPGRAQLAAWIPVILVAVLVCGCGILGLGLLGAAINGASNP